MITAEAAKANTDAVVEGSEKTVLTNEAEGDKKVEVVADKKVEAKEEPGTDGKAEITLKLPEGSLLDAKAVEEISAFSKAQGLTPERAQALLERESKLVATKADEQKSQWDKVTSAWVNDAKADSEIGGDGFAKNIELAKRVVDKFATPEFKKALVDSGFGNHPELIRVFHRIAKSMSADTWVKQGSVTPAPKTAAEIFYGPDKKDENAGQ